MRRRGTSVSGPQTVGLVVVLPVPLSVMLSALPSCHVARMSERWIGETLSPCLRMNSFFPFPFAIGHPPVELAQDESTISHTCFVKCPRARLELKKLIEGAFCKATSSFLFSHSPQ